MFELNNTKKTPVTDKYGPLFLRIRRTAIIAACIFFFLISGQVLLFLHEASALRQKMTELQQDIARRKNIHEIDKFEHEWANYTIEIVRAACVLDARSTWGKKLEILSRTIPRGLYLDFINGGAAPSGGRNRMVLETVDVTKGKRGKELALNFMEQLKKEKEFGRKIEINYEEWSTIDGKRQPLIQIYIELP
jgi:Tfp pilus assembly protein PilN